MRQLRLGLCPALWAVAIATLMARPAAAHPVHTTYTDIAYSRDTGRINVTIRVFADDFVAASQRLARARVAAGLSPKGAYGHYLHAHFAIRDGKARRVGFRVERMWRSGDVVWIRLTGHAARGLKGGSVHNTLLFDMFDDQVNVVRLNTGKGVKTVLFLPGARAKRIR